MDKQANELLEKVIFALSVCNDNIIVVNDKVDILLRRLALLDSDPGDPDKGKDRQSPAC